MERIPHDSAALDREVRLRALLLQGLDGQASAYHEFLKQLSVNLRGFFRKRLTRLPDEVEDLVQETLIAVHRQRHTYRAAEPLTAWVYAIARYKLVDLFRARSIREVLNDPLDEALALFSSADSDAAEAKRDLDLLLAGLPDKQRLPILHVKLQGLSVVQTAQLTGLSESAVKIGVHRGLKALAAKIKGHQ